MFAQPLQGQFGGQEATLLAHPRLRLLGFTSRGRGPLLHHGARWATPLGYAAAFASNLLQRRALAGWLQRVVVSDPWDALPFVLGDFATRRVALAADNLGPAILASGSIPFVLQPVHHIAGAPRGANWDGSITDYHLHLPYAGMADGLLLYLHVQRALVPGWLDKGLNHRHGATGLLDNVVVMAAHADWVRRLPGGKLPDRQDFKTWRHDPAGRITAWTQAVAAPGPLADEAAVWWAQSADRRLALLIYAVGVVRQHGATSACIR